MADEARSYFDGPGMEDREVLEILSRLSFACESLKVTTRLMHIIAWLLAQKAWRRGEISDAVLESAQCRLGAAAPSDEQAIATLPPRAQDLVTGSQALYERVWRLQEGMRKTIAPQAPATPETPSPGPARELLDRLRRSL